MSALECDTAEASYEQSGKELVPGVDRWKVTEAMWVEGSPMPVLMPPKINATARTPASGSQRNRR